MRSSRGISAMIVIGMSALLGWVTAGGGLAVKPEAKANESAEVMDRTVLPIPEPKYPPISELDVRNAKAPPRFQVKAPASAPNVLIVLIDDMGFGQSSAFGGPIHMPTAEKLAGSGLRYNQFHTTALCSPTRAALLTGRNHHMCNMGIDYRDRHGVPGPDRPTSRQRGASGRDAPAQRLRHSGVRQVS